MATDSKEQVAEQKLKKIRQAQKKLMSPLPAKLKQLVESAAIKLLGKKMQQVPGFVDFHPLENMNWKPLADVENSQQAETLTPEEARLGETIRKKIRDRKNPAPLFEQSETATAGNRKTDKSRADKKLPSAFNSIQTAIADKQADKQTAVAGELKSDATPAAEKSKQRRKPDQISTQEKPHRPIKSTPRTLAVLLDKIANLGQSLDPSIPAAAGIRSGNKAGALIADAAARPKSGDAKTKGLKTSKKQKLKVDSLINKSKQAGKPKTSASLALKKTNKKKPSTDPWQDDSEGLGLLSELIDSLWRQQAQGHAAVSRSRTAVAAALSTPPADASSLVLSTRASVAAALALPEIEARATATPVPADEAPSSAPSLNQAEELAEQINRVIREQAWLRGVNLP
ncbi:MAG: hypothetical protein GY875_03090 [Gammaproteobacteria bacterium]|nr:hypothetical protein [Gammaproteobacteria bacterium]